jgi:hypothetical protein
MLSKRERRILGDVQKALLADERFARRVRALTPGSRPAADPGQTCTVPEMTAIITIMVMMTVSWTLWITHGLPGTGRPSPPPPATGQQHEEHRHHRP